MSGYFVLARNRQEPHVGDGSTHLSAMGSVGRRVTEKKLSKKVRNHQVMYTVTTIGKSTAQPPKNFLDSQLPKTLCRACV